MKGSGSAAVAAFAGGVALIALLAYGGPSLPAFVLPFLAGLLAGSLVESIAAAALASSLAWLVGLAWLLRPPDMRDALLMMDGGVLERGAAIFRQSFSTPLSLWAPWLLLAAGLTTGRLLAKARLRHGAGVIALLLLSLCLAQGACGFDPPRLRGESAEAAPGAYGYDGFLHMKCWYLMERGADYYEAFPRAFAGDTRGMRLTSLEQWRTPFLFTLWKWILPPRGEALFVLYLLFAVAAMASSHAIAWHYGRSPLAMLAPAALFPLYLYGAAAFFYPFTEYWAASLALVSLALYLRGAKVPALVVAAHAFLAKELLLFFLVGMSVDYARATEAKAARTTVLIALWSYVLAFMGLHYLKAASAGGGWELSGAGRFLMLGGAPALEACLAFGSLLTAAPYATRGILVVLGIGGILLSRGKAGGTALIAGAIAPCTLFLFCSHGPVAIDGVATYCTDYWGLIALPLLLTMAPVGLAALLRAGPGAPGKCAPPS